MENVKKVSALEAVDVERIKALQMDGKVDIVAGGNGDEVIMRGPNLACLFGIHAWKNKVCIYCGKKF